MSVGHAALPWPLAASTPRRAADWVAHRRIPGTGAAGKDDQPPEKPADLVLGCRSQSLTGRLA